jgi:sugar O-acyltransferase (sialic acid O-acetyltransferase NeuD family)
MSRQPDNSPGATDIAIVGAGGHAKVVIEAIRAQSRDSIACLVDRTRAGELMFDIPIVGDYESIRARRFVIAIGDNHVRRQEFARLCELGWEPITVIHPRATVSTSVNIGAGTVVFAGAIINAQTTIGNNCIVNTGATIDHDCMIGDHVHIAPGANLAGTVTVEEGAFIGIGTCIIPKMTIGHWSTVGAGSVVIRPVDNNTVVAGAPAKLLRSLAEA